MSRLLGGKKRIRATVGDAGPPRHLPHGHPAVQVEGVTEIYNEDTPQQLLALDNISMEIGAG